MCICIEYLRENDKYDTTREDFSKPKLLDHEKIEYLFVLSFFKKKKLHNIVPKHHPHHFKTAYMTSI